LQRHVDSFHLVHTQMWIAISIQLFPYTRLSLILFLQMNHAFYLLFSTVLGVHLEIVGHLIDVQVWCMWWSERPIATDMHVSALQNM
jgi:hypothetical protein